MAWQRHELNKYVEVMERHKVMEPGYKRVKRNAKGVKAAHLSHKQKPCILPAITLAPEQGLACQWKRGAPQVGGS